MAKTRSQGVIEGYGYAIHGKDAADWLGKELAKRSLEVLTTSPARRPLRASRIARKLPASVTVTGLESFEATFDAPATGVVPGQAAVVYDEQDQAVLFSGWIG